jgi:hypothetical protein
MVSDTSPQLKTFLTVLIKNFGHERLRFCGKKFISHYWQVERGIRMQPPKKKKKVEEFEEELFEEEEEWELEEDWEDEDWEEEWEEEDWEEDEEW